MPHPPPQDCYRAPELAGTGAYDPCYADVWSLGITLFFFVSCLAEEDSWL